MTGIGSSSGCWTRSEHSEDWAVGTQPFLLDIFQYTNAREACYFSIGKIPGWEILENISNSARISSPFMERYFH